MLDVKINKYPDNSPEYNRTWLDWRFNIDNKIAENSGHRDQLREKIQETISKFTKEI